MRDGNQPHALVLLPALDGSGTHRTVEAGDVRALAGYVEHRDGAEEAADTTGPAGLPAAEGSAGQDEEIRRATLAILRELSDAHKAHDLLAEHCVIETDPETGGVQVFGPYPDADAAAQTAAARQQWHAAHTGTPAMEYKLALWYSADEEPRT